jgi:RHS repeat-associated protein
MPLSVRVSLYLSLVLTLYVSSSATAQPQPGPLWIAESQAVLEVDRYSGVEISRVPGSAGALAVRVDPERDLVWLLFPRQLFGHDTSATTGPPRRIQLPETVGRGAQLFVLPQDGSLWVSSSGSTSGSGRLLGFTAAGQSLPPVDLPGPARKVAFDATRGVLWVAVSGGTDTLVGIDPLTGAIVEEIPIDLLAQATEQLPAPPPVPVPPTDPPSTDPGDGDDPTAPPAPAPPADPEAPENPRDPTGEGEPEGEPGGEPGGDPNPEPGDPNGRSAAKMTGPEILSVAVDGDSSEIWVGLHDALVRVSPEGAELSRVGLPSPALDVASDRRGGVWVALAPVVVGNSAFPARVVRLNADGEVGADSYPFALAAGDGEAEDLVEIVPDFVSLWVVGRREVMRMIRDGRSQRRFDLGEEATVESASLQSLTGDTTPPSLSFTLPLSGHTQDGEKVDMEWLGSDLDSGVDIQSLTVEHAASQSLAELAKFADTQKSNGIVGSGSVPGPGTYTLTARVRDYAGNLSGPTQVTVTILDESQVPGAGGPSVFSPIQPERGFEPNKAFDFQSGIDTISLSSGNLVLSIPIGQAYSVGPQLAYQLRLTHNSNSWDPIKIPVSYSDVCGSNPSQGGCPDILFSVPSPSSNAGLGWELHLGRLFPPGPSGDRDGGPTLLWPNRIEDPGDQNKAWLYIAPDGSSHTLHSLKDWDNGNDTNFTEVRYAKDGSNLRMRRLGQNVVLLEEPNGLVTEFRLVSDEAGTLFCNGSAGKCWRFHEKRDRRGNYLRASYSRNGAAQEETWTLTDSTGRTQRLVFGYGTHPSRAGGDGNGIWAEENGDQFGDLRRVLLRAEVASFGGGSATYSFNYTTMNLRRTEPHDENNLLPAGADFITVPVLNRIDVPAANDYIFTTLTDATDSGRIKKIRLPSQGYIEYDYRWWDFPTACVYTEEDDVEAFYQLRGVHKKRLVQLDGTTPEGEWTYESTLHPAILDSQLSGTNCARSQYRESIVSSPAGVDGKFNRSVQYHSVVQAPKNPNTPQAITSWQVTDSGLPYSKHAFNGSGSNRAFLSEERQQCVVGGSNSVTCTTHEITYRRYASGLRTCTQGSGVAYQASAGCYQAFARPVLERRVYPLDGNRSVETRWSNFDEIGQARQVQRIDGFDSQTTTVTTNFTQTLRTLNPDTNGYLSLSTIGSALPSSKTWILHPYSKITRSRGGITRVREAVFDGNGSLTCERIWRDGGGRSTKDLVRSLILGTSLGIDNGLPVTEVLAGGDTATSLSVNTLCSTPNTGNGSHFTITHGYQHLQRRSSKYNAAGQPFFFQVDIDRNTGLPSASYDIAGKRTTLSFDALGRLTQMTPEASLAAATGTATYNNLTNAKPTVRVVRQFGGATLTDELTELDEFGRFWRSRIRQPLPGPGNNYQETLASTLYDAAGRVRSEVTRQAIGSFTGAKATNYSDFDAFDRPGRIQLPDLRNIFLTYQGLRIETRRSDVRTSATTTQEVVTSRTFDADGQVVKQENPLYATEFDYDPDGNVIAARRKVGTLTLQSRSYSWDGRGFLTQEILPEIGPDGSTSGTISYQRDALGNIRTMTDPVRVRSYTYDAGGRPLTMKVGNQDWQDWVWGTTGGTNSFGKLIEARRHNYPFGSDSDWAISEKYEYNGVLGAVSKRTTQIQFPLNTGADQWGEAFEQEWTYTALGNVATVKYPVCILSPNTTNRKYCQDGNDLLPPAGHTATVGYNQGLPVSVASNFPSIQAPSADFEYHPNLTLARIGHSNDVEDIHEEDPQGQPRPRRILIQKPNENPQLPATVHFDTGTYQYDDDGNIWAIGVDRYIYDKAGRLTSGQMLRYGTTVREDSTYDALDNILSQQRPFDGVNSSWFVDGKNRVRGPIGQTDIFYDGAGNVLRVGLTDGGLTRWESAYDALNMQQSFTTRNKTTSAVMDDYRYVYGPGNYRFLVWDGATRTVTLRGLDNKPQRRYVVTGFGTEAQWDWQQDSLYGPNGIFAAVRNDGNIWHYHPDHLGSPRILTSQWGSYIAEHHYHPYGAEHYRFGPGRPDDLAAKFTGHERDANGVTDYMLGRTYYFPLARFGSVDPARDGWNLYGYVRGNPLKFVDPTGLAPHPLWNPANSGKMVVVTKGNYVFKRFPYDSYHGGEHIHVFDRRTGELLGRVSTATGEVVDDGKVPNKAIKLLKKVKLLRPVAKLIGPAAIIAQIADILIAEKIEAGELFTDEEIRILLEIHQQQSDQDEAANNPDSDELPPVPLDDAGIQ